MAGKRVKDFRPASKNANRHTARGLGALETSIQTDGWIGAMTTAADGEMIAGSARIEKVADVFGVDAEPIVIESDGTRPIVVVRRDIASADDPRARRLALADNRIHEIDLAWDPEILMTYDASDLQPLWTAEELANLGQQWADAQRKEQDDPGAQIDKAAELQEKWQVKPGDLWQLGEHRLICGDCTDAAVVARVMDGEKADTLIFDPEWDDFPSAITGYVSILAFCDGATIGKVTSIYGAPTWVFCWDCVSCWYTPNRPLRRMKLCAWYGDIATYNFDGWHYGDGGEARDVWNTRGKYRFVPDSRGKHLADVFNEPITKLHAGSAHNHSKPIDWITLLIGNCSDGIVFDPFLGSGTTLIACERLGRRCRAVEISPAYCAVALERWSTMTGAQPALAESA